MKTYLSGLLLFAALQSFANYSYGDSSKISKPKTVIIDADNAGLKLPKGFGALKVAENIGRARHIAVTPQGSVFVKTSKLVDGKGILELKDTDGDGKAEVSKKFGTFTGTGITVKNGYLYACSDEQVFRYKLDANSDVINADAPEVVITGLLNRRQHENKTVALDDAGNIYVNIGAYSNSCQEKDRTNNSKGMMPCPILDSAGGIWKFKADKLNQTYGNGLRYATGLRNVVGLRWNSQTNSLFVMQHGRDQLYQNWPQFYDSIAGAELPSECMFEVKQGSNCGWPYTYYNHLLGKKMVAPEYGGDGKLVSNDTAFQAPVVGFPGHMAPNDILFYTGNQFPERYKNGAFIAFHGSWNRAPLPQKGYFVVFQPFKNGKPNGDWEVFADGFSGKEVVTSTRSAEHRPCGLSQGADGSLYVSDDSKGTIYRILYSGK
jgi:glucose/arabinose dehydrogenase